jgi:hypothetical protein
MGSEPCQTPFTMVSTAVWEVREARLSQHNWVERNAFEVNRYLWEQHGFLQIERSTDRPDQAGFGFAIVGSCPRSSPTSSARAQAAARIAAWSNAVIEPGDRRLQDRYGHLLNDFDRSH